MATTQSYQYSLPEVIGQALTDLLRFQLLEREGRRLSREQLCQRRKLEQLEERFLADGRLELNRKE